MSMSNQAQRKLRDYLTSLVPTEEMIDRFFRIDSHSNSHYDGTLGWVEVPRRRKDGVDGSVSTYSYELDGGRRIVHGRGLDARVHTYGDSFTLGSQVSDGETWQEFLSAHLQEPIRNFGVGGYSVYQAYLRMRRVEREDGVPYLILNIWADDHFRNLDRWRTLRMGGPGQWMVPHLRVNMEQQSFDESPCMTGEEIRGMTDPDFVWETFRDDPVLRVIHARRLMDEPSKEDIGWLADGFGFRGDAYGDLRPDERAKVMHCEAALFASQRVVEMAESFAQTHDRKLMLILSFSKRNVEEALSAGPLFDQSFLDWLETKNIPVFDFRDAFASEFKRSSLEAGRFLDPYYIGTHHSPLGNFFSAWALKDRLVEWLEPKPLPYC